MKTRKGKVWNLPGYAEESVLIRTKHASADISSTRWRGRDPLDFADRAEGGDEKERLNGPEKCERKGFLDDSRSGMI
jgi:hypothetical protein